MNDIAEMLSNAKAQGYQQGRADTLQECWEKYNKIGYGFFEEWLAEELKSVK